MLRKIFHYSRVNSEDYLPLVSLADGLLRASRSSRYSQDQKADPFSLGLHQVQITLFHVFLQIYTTRSRHHILIKPSSKPREFLDQHKDPIGAYKKFRNPLFELPIK